MSSSSLDAEIDALFQTPRSEFVAARNALAKRAGTRAAEIKSLAKPNAAAWAVNQLFWNKRHLFDAVVKTTEAVRRAHVRKLEGRTADPAGAEAQRDTAIEKATGEAVALLSAAGDAASDATSDSIRKTLAGVPSPDIRGRLSKPVDDATGFGLLANLMAASERGPSAVVSMGHGRTGMGRLTAAAERRALSEAERNLRAAEAADHEAAAALTKARKQTERADARVEGLEQALRAARAAAGTAREDADRARLTANEAAAARVKAERRVRELRPE